MNRIHIRNYALCYLFGRAGMHIKMIYRTVVIINGLIKRRNIYAADLRRFFQESLLRPALGLCSAQEREKLVIHLLALAEQEDVDKIGHRLGIERRRSACYDKRQQSFPVGAVDRYAGHIHHIEHGRIRHLIAYRESQHIMLGYRVSAFKRVQSNAVLLHLLVHIAPRSIDALAPDIRQLVHR